MKFHLNLMAPDKSDAVILSERYLATNTFATWLLFASDLVGAALIVSWSKSVLDGLESD